MANKVINKSLSDCLVNVTFSKWVDKLTFVNEFLSFALRFRAKTIIHIFVENYHS